MSHDFLFWETDEPLEDAEGAEVYLSYMETGQSERAKPSEKVALMAREVSALWPTPSSGSEDDWSLASPPEVSATFLCVCISPSQLWNVWPTLGKLAKTFELVMYDPQQTHVFLPPRLSQKRTRLRAKMKNQKPE